MTCRNCASHLETTSEINYPLKCRLSQKSGLNKGILIDCFTLERPSLVSDSKLQSQIRVDLTYQRSGSLILLEDTSM